MRKKPLTFNLQPLTCLPVRNDDDKVILIVRRILELMRFVAGIIPGMCWRIIV